MYVYNYKSYNENKTNRSVQLLKDMIIQSYLFQSNGHTCYDIVVWSSLKARKDGSVDLCFVVVLDLLAQLVHTFDPFTVKDETSTRSTKGLVGCRGNNITVLKGTWMQLYVCM